VLDQIAAETRAVGMDRGMPDVSLAVTPLKRGWRIHCFLCMRPTNTGNISVTGGKWCQEPFLGRPLLRMVFSNPNCATAFLSHFSEPYGRLFFIAWRIFSTSSFGCERLSHCR